jgi:hypothetical protein
MAINAEQVRRRSRRYRVQIGNEVKRLNECSTEEMLFVAMDLIDATAKTVKVLSIANVGPNKYRKA